MVKPSLTLTVLLSTVLGLSPLSAQTEEMSERAIAPPEMIQTLPANTAAVLLLNGQKAWQEFERFQGFDGISEVFTDPGFLPFVPFVGSDEDEVRPWMQGWTATAVIPLSSFATDMDMATVTIMPLADEPAFDTYLSLLEIDYGISPTQETYQGVEIQVYPQIEVFPNVSDVPEVPDFWPDPPREMQPPKWGRSQQLLNQYLLTPLSKLLGKMDADGSIETPFPTPDEEMAPYTLYKPSVAIARLPNNTVIFARRLEDIQAYLDIPPTTVSLADNPEFQKLLHRPELDTAVVALYGNFKQLADLSRNLDSQAPNVPFVLPPGSGVSQIGDLYAQTYTSFNALIWADDAGGRLQFRSNYREPQPEIAAASQNPNRILSRLPGGTYVSTNGINLGQSLLALVSMVEGIPEMASVLDGVRGEIRQSLGLELQDLFQWMDGEFALFLYPPIGGNQDALLPFLPFEIGLYFQTGDRPAAEQVLSALDNWILNISEGFIEISRESLDNQPFTSWNLPMGFEDETLSQVAHGWITEDTLLLTTGMASVNRLYPQPRVRLLDSYNFQTAIAPFPDNRTSLAYYNLGAIVAATRDLWRSPMVVFDDTIPLEGEELPPDPFFEFLQSLRSLSLGVSIDEEREQLDIRLVLSPKRH
ncbi:DUF3352 domain-containing protein [Sodalinema gerasimenkoae]|uniref:DUF3352 domain-containing protein n=1 Tax=Sodalinema gerasimenkoae TaxID=2862348 RepID=UPI0013573EE0|nr:DUF3352 domain-containing protein [Sodalinema gerasimenkoae]